jgi:hypothetical protein
MNWADCLGRRSAPQRLPFGASLSPPRSMLLGCPRKMLSEWRLQER